MTKFSEEYAARAAAFLANPSGTDDAGLWAILRSTNAHTEINCRVICTAKSELRKRGHAIA